MNCKLIKKCTNKEKKIQSISELNNYIVQLYCGKLHYNCIPNTWYFHRLELLSGVVGHSRLMPTAQNGILNKW